MTEYSKISHSTWTPEQIEAHCKAIGADKRPADKPKDSQLLTTAPQLNSGRSRYRRKGGEY